jgi:ankyrin repeat protein
LFGERLTKQFLSESISILDNVIFALSPLGVLTAVVSVIRICGSSSLRAFVGRAQEGPAEAESELLPCVSESTAELFNDGGITRVFGRAKIVEIVAWEDVDHKTGEKGTKIGTLKHALEQKAWSCSGKVSPTELPELDIPNLSLNKGIKRRDQFWFHCAAIIGGVLQTGQYFFFLPEITLTIPLGTITYATLTVFVYPQHFKKDDKAIASYAFPLYLVGTTLLFLGMFFCAFIMERSSKEFYLKAEKPSKIYWLQPGNQNVGDQVFNAFLAVNEGPESSMTKKLRYIKSIRDRRFDRKYLEIYSTVASTVLGFIFQFIGLRGLHASVILAQLGSTFLMSIIRTCLRTERMAPDENKMKDDRELTSHKQQEMDCFAFYLEKVESFELASIPDRPANMPSPRFTPHLGTPLAKQLIRTRTQLARLTTSSRRSLEGDWNGMPIRQIACNLAETIEATMDLMSSWGVEVGKTFEFRLGFMCKGASLGSVTEAPGTYSIGLMRCGDALRWKSDVSELEAILGLWTWSLYKSDENWCNSTLCRLIGLNEDEASREETLLYFHKWIFRQTEARLVPSAGYDNSSRLFSFEPKDLAYDGKILAVRTDNEVETMVAQDIYIQFLKELFLNLSDLGGDVDVIPELQNSFIASSTRIDDLIHCFENSKLGSREDALLCIVPVLRYRCLLPDLAADSAKVRARRDRLIEKGEWKSAFALLRWICQRSGRSEFERSVYELGFLCRRALLDTDKHVRKEGLEQTCALLTSDIRDDFLKTHKNMSSLHRSASQDRIEWWNSFSRQLGWVAWNISTNLPDMASYQPTLRSLNVPEDLQGSHHHNPDPDATQKGIHAVKDWLTLYNVDSIEREQYSEDEALGFEWITRNNFHALLHFLLLRWVELGEDFLVLVRIGYTLAARTRSERAFDILRRQGADIEAIGPDNHSALNDRVFAQDLEGSRLLLENGADPNGNLQHMTISSLVVAAHEGFDDIVTLLLKFGANIETTDPAGSRALHWAVKNDHPDTVRLLLSHGAEIDPLGPANLTPLQSAAMDNQVQMAELLIEKGADVNAIGQNGKTAMMLSIHEENLIPMWQLLVDNGARLDLVDYSESTVLDQARRLGHTKAVSFLCQVLGIKELRDTTF